MLSEYKLDYRKAKPNRFAGRVNAAPVNAAPVKKDQRVVILDPDVSKIFTSSEAVNKVLRALIANMPPTKARKTASE